MSTVDTRHAFKVKVRDGGQLKISKKCWFQAARSKPKNGERKGSFAEQQQRPLQSQACVRIRGS